MCIALATRGYICPRGQVPPFGVGPPIVQAQSLSPGVVGVVDKSPPGPSITGSGLAGPSISSSSSTATPPTAGPPSIVGGGPLIPGVNDEDEE